MTTTLSTDSYGRTVVLQGDGLTYIITNPDRSTVSIQFSSGTPLVQVYSAINAMEPPTLPLGQAITKNIAMAQAAVQAFIDGQYSLETRFNLMAIYNLAVKNGLTNRAAYVDQLFTWAQSVVESAASYVTTVMAMTDAATVASTSPDFSSLIASDPKLTAVAAIAISN